MGQRHQVYLRLPKIYYNKDNGNNKPETTIAIHHQWLFGVTALKLLKNFLTFAEIDLKDTYSRLKTNHSDALDILAHAYSFNASEGYYSGVYKFDSAEDKKAKVKITDDPTQGDNNNGITIIDLTGKSPTYCFLSIAGLETLHEGKGKSYDNFYPIDTKTWVELHYGNGWQGKDKAPEGAVDAVNFLSKYKTITPERLKEIFPKLKSEINEGIESNKLRVPQSVRFINSLKTKKVTKSGRTRKSLK